MYSTIQVTSDNYDDSEDARHEYHLKDNKRQEYSKDQYNPVKCGHNLILDP